MSQPFTVRVVGGEDIPADTVIVTDSGRLKVHPIAGELRTLEPLDVRSIIAGPPAGEEQAVVP